MWYKIAQQNFQNIADTNSPSHISGGGNAGFSVDYPTAQNIKKSLDSHQPYHFTTTDGKQFLVLHGNYSNGVEYFDVGGTSIAEQDLAQWMRNNGMDPTVTQILACGVGNVNPATGLHPAIDITGITNLSIPTTPPADTNPVTVGVS